MNYRIIPGWMTCFVFFIVNAHAQSVSLFDEGTNSQTALFGQLPQKSPCDLQSLERLFSATGKVSTSIAPGITFQGEVFARTVLNESVSSINIKLSGFGGAVFTLSRIQLEDGSLRYNGHLLCVNHRDAIILSIENGRYFFVKTEQRLVLTD